MKHEINLNGKFNTNMIDEIKNKNIKVTENIYISKIKDSEDKYTTIYFNDLTDQTNYKLLKSKFKKELKKYLEVYNSYLIIGIGNNKSNMDSLGPETLNNILVTKHLKQYGLDKKYKLVSKFYPDVENNTGINSYDLIKNIIKYEHPEQVIFIDSLITNNLNNITKCIQISTTGINLGKHLYKKALTSNNLKVPVILIGIPTILETDKLNIIITTKDIDKFIKKSAQLIGESINELIHNYSFTKDVPE